MDLPQSRIRWKARRNLMDMAVYKIGLMALNNKIEIYYFACLIPFPRKPR